MKRIVLVGLLAAIVLIAACGKSGDTSGHSNDHAAGHGQGMDHGGPSMAPEADKEKANSVKANFRLSKAQPQPKQDTMISISVQDKDGNPIDQFDINHEKEMHVIVVSKDLSFFNHIHPENKGKGEFTVTTQFPTAGEFEVISDFAPTGMGAMTKKQWITVQGNAPSPQPIVPDTDLTKMVDRKEVTLSMDHLMANMEIKLTFHIKDAKSGEPITNLQPYLGAVGHVVIMDDKAEEYIHVHPMEEKESGPDASFMATFPHSGVFKIWGQFQQEGEVFTAPYVVQVT
jgi:hypothetical protein